MMRYLEGEKQLTENFGLPGEQAWPGQRARHWNVSHTYTSPQERETSGQDLP